MIIYRINFVATKGTLEIVNTLHALGSGDNPTDPTPHPTLVAEELETNLATEYKALLADSFTFERIDVQTVVDPNDPEQVPVGGTSSVGGFGTRPIGTDDLPTRVGGLIVWRTGYLGGSFTGRFFAPPTINVSALADGLYPVAGGYYVAMAAFAAAWVEAGEVSPASPWSGDWASWALRACVYSPTRHLAAASTHASVITSGSPQVKPAYLSSRDQ